MTVPHGDFKPKTPFPATALSDAVMDSSAISGQPRTGACGELLVLELYHSCSGGTSTATAAGTSRFVVLSLL
jgi:hypothetical protein